MEDLVNSPSHYTQANVTLVHEPCEMCEMYGWHIGDAIKYIVRYQHKGKPMQDLQKAEWHLNKQIKRMRKYNLKFVSPEFADDKDIELINVFRCQDDLLALLLSDEGDVTKSSIRQCLSDIHELIEELKGQE